MTFLSQLRDRLSVSAADGPRIAVFGDSHSAALARAQEFADRKHQYEHIQIIRLRKEKNGKEIGDADLLSFCRKISRFGRDDFVFSAVGGNQYAVISTVQTPSEYDFLASLSDEDIASDRAELIPFRAIANYVREGIRGTMGPILERIRGSTSARVYHLVPPPPKQDNAFIAANFEGRFAAQGLDALGPTRPGLRLKCWKLQLQFLEELCRELDIGLVMPPGRTLTPEGFLAPRFYAKDVTHANRRYGEYVLRQILKFTGTQGRLRDELR